MNQSSPREARGGRVWRHLRRWPVIALVAILALALGVAACGGDDDDDDTPAATEGAALGEELSDLLGEPTCIMEESPGTFEVTASFPLSGPGASYGQEMVNGWEMGAEHVREWTDGALDLQVNALDHRSGDPEAFVDSARRAARGDGPPFLSSYLWGFGAGIPVVTEQELFSIDVGGGTGPLLTEIPYAYGFRSKFPTDMVDGIWMTIQELHPDATTVAVVDTEIAAEYNDANEQYVSDVADELGLDVISYTTAPLGQEDYSGVITEVREQDPDIVQFLTFGADLGFQAREVQRQGIDAIFAGIEYPEDAVSIAGPAFEDWIIGFDYLNVQDPPSDWGQLLVESWQNEHGRTPQHYETPHYVTPFWLATMIDRILCAGGNLRDSDDWVAALEEDPSFPHVYGGEGADTGEVVIDLESHAPESIPMIGFRAAGTGDTGDFEVLSTFDIGGADFEMVASE